MNRINDENRFYNQQLYDKYVSSSGANVFLTVDETKWLAGHGPVRVAYQDDFLSFCDKDDETGELTGALKEYLDHASECFENARLEFEPVAYPTAQAAMDALKKGEADCMFPSNMSTSDCEDWGFVMTPTMMKTEIYAVVRKADQRAFAGKDHVITAVIKGDPNYSAIVMDHFPEWETVGYTDINACLEAVKNKEADAFLISNYQYNSLRKICERFDLTALATGEEAGFHIAVNNGSRELYSILTRTTNLVSGSSINAALTSYSTDESKTTFIEFIRQNPLVVIAAVVLLLALVTVIIAQHRLIRVRKEAEETRHRVDDLNKRVYVDSLTSVRNKGAFDDYMKKLQDRIKSVGPFEFAIAIFDCNDLKLINDKYGHEKGDMYLQASARHICRVFKHSPVFRLGGDEFAVVLQNDDYRNREKLTAQFEKETEESCAREENKWEQVSVSMGLADYDKESDDSVDDTVRRADKNMYENKRLYHLETKET